MNPEVLHNASAQRYEIRVGDELAGFTVAEPTDDPRVILFPHTEIAPAFEGKGLASQLVQGALDDIRERGLRIVVTCPYILGWLPKHPEYEDLLAQD
jgi:predicted GNAT family acetyltransferase